MSTSENIFFTRDRVLEELWQTAPPATDFFDPAMVSGLPEAAQRYLLHALAPGAPLAHAVRLRMHGSLRLKGEWHPLEADQVLRWDRGFVWRARVSMNGAPVTGFDRWVDGKGAMRWKMFGLFPIATAAGPDVARSAAGRFNIESIWMPAVLLGEGVRWTEHDRSHTDIVVRAHGEESHIDLTIDDRGAVTAMKMPRWQTPEGDGTPHYEDFGGLSDQERTFQGITIPTNLRVGWYFGTDRFEPEGEFCRLTIDEAEVR